MALLTGQSGYYNFPMKINAHCRSAVQESAGIDPRTPRYRYVEWQDWESKHVVARELSDRKTDPDEMRNLADETRYAATVEELAQVLGGGWKSASPGTHVQEKP